MQPLKMVIKRSQKLLSNPEFTERSSFIGFRFTSCFVHCLVLQKIDRLFVKGGTVLFFWCVIGKFFAIASATEIQAIMGEKGL